MDISIGGKDAEAANFFNKSAGATTGGTASTESGGYVVDFDGMIEFKLIMINL